MEINPLIITHTGVWAVEAVVLTPLSPQPSTSFQNGFGCFS
jgi:hypothetical protein